MKLTLGEIAARLGAELNGDPAIEITGIGGVRDGGPGDLSFVSQPRYAADAAASQVSALLVTRDWNKPVPAALLKVDKPEVAFTQIARLFMQPFPEYPAGVHPSAVVHATARIGDGVHIGPHVVVESGAVIGAGSRLLAGVVVGQGAHVGENCLLYPHVSLREYVRIGNRCILHNGTVIGSDGFGYAVDKQGVRTKIPQIGIVVLGDDVEIGANCAVDRARFGRTKIGNGVKIDNLVQIAHNVVIGDHAVIVSQAGIAGSTIIGHHVILAGQVGVNGHISIAPGTVVAAQAGVAQDTKPGQQLWGTPARPMKEALELNAHLTRLPKLRKQVAELEARLLALEQKNAGT